MLDVHIARGAVADGGRDRGARWRSRGASASSRWTRTAGSSASRRSRPPPAHALEPGLLPGLHGHLHLRHRRAGPRAARATPRSEHHPRLRPRHHPHAGGQRASASTPTCSGTRTRRPRSTGATWGRWTPTTRPRWTSSRWTPSSTSTTRSGRCAPTSRSSRPPSSSSTRTGGAAMRHRVAGLHGLHRLRQQGPRAASCRPGVRVHSYCDIEDSILMPNATINRHAADPARRSSTARWRCPRGAVIGYDPREDRRRHTVSEGGVVVVTPGEECYVDPQFAGLGERMSAHRVRLRARDPGQPRQPHRGGGGRAGGRRAAAAPPCPPGASTGEREAVELRDGDKKRYLGQGRARRRWRRSTTRWPARSSARTPSTRPSSTS